MNDGGAKISLCFLLSSSVTKLTQSARILGVIFDKYFTFCSHILAVCSSFSCHTRDLRRNRRYRDLDGAILLATALEPSRLNHRNSLLSDITDTDLTNLQRVQNWPALFVTGSLAAFHCFRSLHFLIRKFRKLFKISLLTYKTLHEKQLVYLHSMLAASLPSCSLRSNKELVCRSLQPKPRAFHFCASSLWNNIPLSVRSATSVSSFREQLKTHLSNLAFPP